MPIQYCSLQAEDSRDILHTETCHYLHLISVLPAHYVCRKYMSAVAADAYQDSTLYIRPLVLLVVTQGCEPPS